MQPIEAAIYQRFHLWLFTNTDEVDIWIRFFQEHHCVDYAYGEPEPIEGLYSYRTKLELLWREDAIDEKHLLLLCKYNMGTGKLVLKNNVYAPKEYDEFDFQNAPLIGSIYNYSGFWECENRHCLSPSMMFKKNPSFINGELGFKCPYCENWLLFKKYI